MGPPMDVVPERCRGDGVTASGSLRVQWGWLTMCCRRVLTRRGDGGRRDSDRGRCWQPLRVGWPAAPASAGRITLAATSLYGEQNAKRGYARAKEATGVWVALRRLVDDWWRRLEKPAA